MYIHIFLLIYYLGDTLAKCRLETSQLYRYIRFGPIQKEEAVNFSDIVCYNTTIEDYTYELFKLDISSCKQNSSSSFQLKILNSNFSHIQYLVSPALVRRNNYPLDEFLGVSLNFCAIRTVATGAFKDFENMTDLDMGFNDIDEINFVTDLGAVKKLNLTHNKITNVNFGLFLSSIDILDLSFNWIVNAVFSSKVPFWSFPIKEFLYLNNNYIVQLEISPTLVSGTLEVNLANNNLSSIIYNKADEEMVPNNIHLQLLNLSQSLTDVAILRYLKPYISCTKLIASENYLLVLDKPYNFYPTSYMDFSKCSISNIHPKTFQESVYSYLNFSYNHIKLLSGSPFALSVIQILDLSHNFIENIVDVFQEADIKYLNLSYNRISEVNAKSFKSSTFIYRLDLSFNNVSLNKHSFQNIGKSLTSLNLASNNLLQVDDMVFYNLSKLITLDLKNNLLKNLSYFVFQPLKSIEEINLANNQLTRIPSLLFSNLPLREVIISGNNLKTIQSRSFHNLSNIETININGNHGRMAIKSSAFSELSNPRNPLNIYLQRSKIFKINSEMFSEIRFFNLLDITDSNITSISFSGHIEYMRLKELRITFSGILQKKSFLATIFLQTLVFRNSIIDEVEANAFQGMHNLQFIDLHNSTIRNISDGALRGLFAVEKLDGSQIFKNKHDLNSFMFTDMYNLIYLNLSLIGLQHIEPCTFQGLKRLQKIYLNNNKISLLANSTFFGLPSVEFLDISYNKIMILKKDAFYGLDSLQNLDINNNEINDIELGAFQNNPHLLSLSLANNNITQLKVGTFSNLPQLIELDIQHNRISELLFESFLPLASLQKLNLEFNNLKTIDQTPLVSTLKHLRRISIANNKWKCEYLAGIILTFQKYSIDYSTVNNNFYEDNIEGIRCIDVCKFLLCLQDSHGIN